MATTRRQAFDKRMSLEIECRIYLAPHFRIRIEEAAEKKTTQNSEPIGNCPNEMEQFEG